MKKRASTLTIAMAALQGMQHREVKAYGEPTAIGVIDRSADARTMPNSELRMMIYQGKRYRQFKHHKGMLCLGVSWEECDEDGEMIKQGRHERLGL